MDPRYHATLASLGQRYQNYPGLPQAQFDERFGPFNPDPQEILRRLMIEQQLRREPGVIIPGSPSWPAGYTRI